MEDVLVHDLLDTELLGVNVELLVGPHVAAQLPDWETGVQLPDRDYHPSLQLLVHLPSAVERQATIPIAEEKHGHPSAVTLAHMLTRLSC